jgi:two-component system sensor histidine kinase KdpD
VESLEQFGDRHPPETRTELLRTAAGETRRLSRFIENLLDMSRIDAGAVRARREAREVGDIVEHAISRARLALEDKVVSRDVSSGLPRVLIDLDLSESALANVLENAGKYAPDGSKILVRAYREKHVVVIDVLDEGPGFPETAMANLFDKFARGVEGDGRPPGTGLGLAIAKGFLEAQGGSIAVQNRHDRPGACVRVKLPVEETN